MLTLRSYSLFFRCFNFVLVSCVSFGIKANIDLFDLKHPTVNPELEKITTKKKKKKSLSIVFSLPESCLCHFFYLVQESCHSVVQPPKPIKSTPTAAEPNNPQPPAVAKPNTSPHSPAAKTQNPTPHPRPPPMPKPETSSRHSSMPRAATVSLSLRYHQASVSNAGRGPLSQRLPLSLV